MRTEHLFLSLLGLAVGFMLVFAGFLLFLPPFIPFYAKFLQALVEQHLTGISYFGLSLFFLGVLFLTLFNLLNQRRYLLIKMGGFTVKDRVVAHFAKETLEKLFPGQGVDCSVIIRNKRRIEILANIPHVEEKDRESTLQGIENALADVLQKQFHYDHEFLFNVSFSSP